MVKKKTNGKNSVKAARRKLHTGRAGNPGNVAKYTTRNKALNRLQLKLSEFRRLCILKGIHPREPKKKFEGHNKTYYHVKDINFLAHEPLLEKSREIRAFQRKITKARAKYNEDLAQRLQKVCPTYTLDHLVKERYPSFIDALRDLDDPLTMVHLFATLPADRTHKIPFQRVHNCRRLSLEWQAYVTRTHALRRIFVSVKGIYYQADVSGQKITWLTPHVLNQVLPDDVDFRVMLTFAEFYETLLGFVNFKLYHTLGLNYPPVLDPRLEQVAAELYSLMRDLAGKNVPALPEGETKVEEDTPMAEPSNDQAEESKEKRLAESQARLASLQDRLQRMEKERTHDAPKTEDLTQNKDMEVDDEVEDEDLETRACRRLFRNHKFFLGREVPRESLLFVIRSFGGVASWDADGAPFPESDEGITHQIVDRPTQGHVFLSRQYIQPQWVYDCANSRLLLPAEPYWLGRIPPPHLSPFVDNEAEGHVPEYADTIKRLQLAANKQLLPLPGGETQDLSGELAAAAAARRKEDMEAEKERELAAMEKAYAEDLTKELAGKSTSAEKPNADEEDEPEAQPEVQPKVDEAKDMAKMMMSRSKRKLYQAMQMGKEKKNEGVKLIKERKRKADEKKSKAK